MKVSDAIAKYLVYRGIHHIFGYQGGAVTHLIDSFSKCEGIEYVQNYNEQGASIAAESYVRIKENGIGAAVGTNGPGATNMITGIADAYCDSIPVLILTGQVHTFAMKKSRSIRQESFQELDIISIVRPITKYCITVMDESQILCELEKAISAAVSGRPGPVLLDIPVDIQGKEIPYILPDREKICSCIRREEALTGAKKLCKYIDEAEKPVILAGGGIYGKSARYFLKNIVAKTGIPVVVSLQGLDRVDHSTDEFVGFIGSYGNRYSNIVLQESDLLIVLGSRLDLRQTGKRRDLFAQKAKVVHADIDPAELGHFVKEDLSIHCEMEQFLRILDHMLEYSSRERYEEWYTHINDLKGRYKDTEELEGFSDGLNPNLVMNFLGRILPGDTIVCGDVGQNQMWLAQSLRFRAAGCRILNSGGLGVMGFSLPACIGAYYARKDALIIGIMGDGGFQMNIQELQLAGAKQLPVKVIVMNNRSLGLIRDIHEKYYDCNYIGSVEGFSLPDLLSLAKAYRMNYLCIEKREDFKKLVNEIENRMPAIIEIILGEKTYVKPELLGMDGLNHQIPYKTE